MWKDANGTVLPVVAMKGESEILFQDGNGWIWSYDLFGGSPYASGAFGQYLATYYTTANCSGAGYVSNSTPTRYTFPGGQAWQVRPDNIAPILITWQSSGGFNGCSTAGGGQTISVIPVTSLTSIDFAPSGPGVAPIHVELTP